MSKRFHNLDTKIASLISSKKYFVSIPPARKVSYEEDYHNIAIDPDGKKRFLLKEKKFFFKKNKHVINFLKKSKPGKIIDVGCGLGWFLSSINSSWDKYGIDVSEFAVKNASKYCKAEKIDLEKFLITNKYKSKFDYVIFSHVIEHLKNPVFVLKNLKKLLKKNGTLLLETPDFDSPAYRLFKNKFRLLNDPTHISLFTLDSMTRALRDNGFVIKKIEFPFFKTDYFNKNNLLKLINYKKEKVSPPFYGSVMFFLCKLK